MKNSYRYAILFGLLGLVVAFIAAMATVALFAGIFWLFIYGDNPWPNWSDYFLGSVALIVFLSVWLLAIYAGFQRGCKQNTRFSSFKTQLIYSITATGIMALSVALFLIRGELRPKTLSEQCAKICLDKGYYGSSTSPNSSGKKTCSCFDETINDYIEIGELPEK